MELSERLSRLLRVLNPCHILLDVGCDHGFLSIEAVRQGRAQQAIASDVRQGPLEKAREHIQRAGLTERIQIRLTDGLSGYHKDEADAIVIAGMGGRLMSRILEEAYSTPDSVLFGCFQLILQPQSEWQILRETLERIGFVPAREDIFYDREKLYWILDCRPVPGGAPVHTYDYPWQYTYGRLLSEAQDPVLWEYLTRQQDLKLRLLSSLEEQTSSSAAARKEALETELTNIQEALKTWA